MITIEKVAALRSVPIFASIPDDVLASIARIAEEVALADGEVFIEEGALGDCMYLIVEGRVRVYSRGHTIILLDAGQTVGELAVLDPEPRSASVAAAGAALLFRIDKAAFDEVMADRAEIAQAVIRALCRRVRDQGRRAAQSGAEASAQQAISAAVDAAFTAAAPASGAGH